MTNAVDPGDAQFGRAAAEKQEAADEMAARGEDPTQAPEGPGVEPRPAAGTKAVEGGTPAAGSGAAPDDGVDPDEESKESFPASDPPADY